MTREGVIKRLKLILRTDIMTLNELNISHEPLEKEIEALKIAIQDLEQKPRWIPVTERLPEDEKEVLVYLSSNRMTLSVYNSHILPTSKEPIGWGYRPQNGKIDFYNETVIAWMPLPEPYKAESENKE